MKKYILWVMLAIMVVIVGVYFIQLSKNQVSPSIKDETFENLVLETDINFDNIVNNQDCDESRYKLIFVENSGDEGWVRYVNRKHQYSFEYPYKKICIDDLDVTGFGLELDYESAYVRGTHNIVIYINRIYELDTTDEIYIEPTIDLYIDLVSNEYKPEKRFVTNQGLDAVVLYGIKDDEYDNQGDMNNLKQMVFMKDKVLHIFTVSFLDEISTNRILESIKFEDITEY